MKLYQATSQTCLYYEKLPIYVIVSLQPASKDVDVAHTIAAGLSKRHNNNKIRERFYYKLQIKHLFAVRDQTV